MTREEFFNKFEVFAEAPGAVAKMRELIIQIAVQGRLVDPSGNDEPVEKFLKRIWADKSCSRAGLTDAERPQPFDIPGHWRWVLLAEIAEFSIGKTPPRRDSSYWYPEDHSWVSIADMKHYGTINETKEKVSALAAKNVFRERFAEPGSILMSFKLTIGKVARTEIPCFHNEAIISLLPPEPELAEYLFRFLPVFAALQKSNNAIKGSTLNKDLLTLLPIALPPLAEQKRIVAKVEELMALCDELEAQQKEREEQKARVTRAALAKFNESPTLENLSLLSHPSYQISPSDLRKTILSLAVQGKLVPQDSNEEPAISLIAKIKMEKEQVALRSGRNSKLSSSSSSTPSDILVLPQSWSLTTLGTLVFSVGDGPHFSPKYVSKNEGVPFLSTRNISTVGFQLHDVKHISVDDYRIFCKKVKPEPGDILYTKGGTTGIALVNDLEFDFNVWVHIAVLKVVQKFVNNQYLALALNSPFCYDQSQKLTHGIGNKDLGLTRMVNISVPLPPLAEQKRIVAKVEELMALVDQLEAQEAESRRQAALLLDALVSDLTAN